MDRADQRGVSEGDRRHGGTYRLGRVEEIDGARVRVRLAPDLLTDWLPWATWAAGKVRCWCPPTEGEQCEVVSPSGEPHLAVARSGVWCDAFEAPKTDPEQFILAFQGAGYITVNMTSKTMHLSAPCGVFIDGTLVVMGDVQAGGGQISMLNHRHGGVRRGPNLTAGPTGGGEWPCPPR